MTLPGDQVNWTLHECDGPPSYVLSYEEAHRVLSALRHAASHLGAVDESNAHANLAEVRHRPLTREVIHALRELDGLLHSGLADRQDDTPEPEPAVAGEVRGR